MDLKLEVSGLNDLQRQLRTRPPALQRQLRETNREAARMVGDTAAVLVPVRSGRLRSTIRATGGQREASVRAGNTTTVPYAAPVHWGWPGRPNPERGIRGGPIRPQPFIYRAFDRRIVEVRDRYETNLHRVMSVLDTY